MAKLLSDKKNIVIKIILGLLLLLAVIGTHVIKERSLGSTAALILFISMLACIPMVLAKKKGRKDLLLWWLYGALVFFIALIHAIIMKPIEGANWKKCPFCAEMVKREANICKHCGKDL